MTKTKGQLNYSPLTEQVYWVDGRGVSHNVHQNFLQMMLCFLTEAELPEKEGEGFEKVLTVEGKVSWTIRIYKGDKAKLEKKAKKLKKKDL